MSCSGDLPGPWLALYSPGEPEYTDVVVRRVHDTLTLVCELRGDTSAAPRVYVWNYMDDNSTSGDQILKGDPKGPAVNSTLIKFDLQESDSGQYMCSAPPFSVTKYILVQTRGPTYCRRGAFWCGTRCIAAQYVCDGRLDCQRGEDEAGHMCPPLGCARSDKLNCSSGRCISESACCRSASALCPQPSCCDEHPRYSRLEASNIIPQYAPFLIIPQHPSSSLSILHHPSSYLNIPIKPRRPSASNIIPQYAPFLIIPQHPSSSLIISQHSHQTSSSLSIQHHPSVCSVSHHPSASFIIPHHISTFPSNLVVPQHPTSSLSMLRFSSSLSILHHPSSYLNIPIKPRRPSASSISIIFF
ncbi:unnamed protein product [Spodoptera exigua]|nr:unnamed protein product [Spodoptera exigua]